FLLGSCGSFPMTRFLFAQDPRLIVLSSYSRWGDGKSTATPFLFQLPNPLLQELPLRLLLGQRQRFLIGSPSFSRPSQPAAHIGTGGMRQVVICQFATLQHRVDLRQAGLRTIPHGNGYGTIELYNRRWLNSYQLVVKRDDLPPVRRGGRFRLRMNGC